jgi:hypothetical protein
MQSKSGKIRKAIIDRLDGDEKQQLSLFEVSDTPMRKLFAENPDSDQTTREVIR